MQAQLKQQYVNPALPGSYSGYGSFSRALKSRGIVLKEKELKEWLQSQPVYTIHRPKRKRYHRNKVIVSGIDDTWQADLVDMQAMSKDNDSYKYILTIIDVFSKHAWAVPLKSKSAKTVITRVEYANGYTLFAFDLTPDKANGCNFNLAKSANLRIVFKFANNLEKPINCIVYMEVENVIEITKERQIVFNQIV